MAASPPITGAAFVAVALAALPPVAEVCTVCTASAGEIATGGNAANGGRPGAGKELGTW